MSHTSELHLRQGKGPLLRVAQHEDPVDDGITLQIHAPDGQSWVTIDITGAERNVVARMIELPELANSEEPEYDDRMAADWLLDQAWELTVRIDQLRTVMSEIRSAFVGNASDLESADTRWARAQQHPAYVAAWEKIARLQEQLRELD